MSITRPTRALARTGFLTTGVGVFVLWNLFTLLGAVGGSVMGDPRTYGLDAAGGVMDWLRQQGRGVAVAGAVVPIVPAAILFDLANDHAHLTSSPAGIAQCFDQLLISFDRPVFVLPAAAGVDQDKRSIQINVVLF